MAYRASTSQAKHHHLLKSAVNSVSLSCTATRSCKQVTEQCMAIFVPKILQFCRLDRPLRQTCARIQPMVSVGLCFNASPYNHKQAYRFKDCISSHTPGTDRCMTAFVPNMFRSFVRANSPLQQQNVTESLIHCIASPPPTRPRV